MGAGFGIALQRVTPEPVDGALGGREPSGIASAFGGFGWVASGGRTPTRFGSLLLLHLGLGLGWCGCASSLDWLDRGASCLNQSLQVSEFFGGWERVVSQRQRKYWFIALLHLGGPTVARAYGTSVVPSAGGAWSPFVLSEVDEWLRGGVSAGVRSLVYLGWNRYLSASPAVECPRMCIM